MVVQIISVSHAHPLILSTITTAAMLAVSRAQGVSIVNAFCALEDPHPWVATAAISPAPLALVQLLISVSHARQAPISMLTHALRATLNVLLALDLTTISV
jgi:hypothetical protein